MCVCEAMGDEMAEPWEGTTEDSYAREVSAVDVGEWRVVEDLTETLRTSS